MNTEVHVGVNCHYHNHDVEGINQENVHHLQVTGLGHHLVYRALQSGDDQHAGYRNHDAILRVNVSVALGQNVQDLEVIYSEVKCHVGEAE